MAFAADCGLSVKPEPNGYEHAGDMESPDASRADQGVSYVSDEKPTFRCVYLVWHSLAPQGFVRTVNQNRPSEQAKETFL